MTTPGGDGQPESEWARLLGALALALPGELIFVTLDAPGARERLPLRLTDEGLRRPWISINLRDDRVLFGSADHALRQEPLPALNELHNLPWVLQVLLATEWPAPPGLIFVDGLEFLAREENPVPGGPLEQLSLGREALAQLPAAVVFLLPALLVEQLRVHALNLWSWRAYDFVLPAEPEAEGISQHTVPEFPRVRLVSPRGDNPEARSRRIRVYQKLLADQEALGRHLEVVGQDIILPLAQTLLDEGACDGGLTLVQRVLREGALSPGLVQASLLGMEVVFLESLGKDSTVPLNLLRELCPALPLRARAIALARMTTSCVAAEVICELGCNALDELSAASEPENSFDAEEVDNLAMLLVAVVPALLRVGRLLEAEKRLNSGIPRVIAVFGKESPLATLVKFNMVALKIYQRKYTDARQQGQELLDIVERYFGESMVHYNLFFMLADACAGLKEWRFAEEYLQGAIGMIGRIGGSREALIPHRLLEVGRARRMQGKGSAEAAFSQGLHLLRKAGRPDPQLFARLAVNQAFLQMKRRAPSEAVKLLEEALVQLSTMPRPATILLGFCHRELAHAFLAQRLTFQAEIHVRKALALGPPADERKALESILAKATAGR